MSEGTTAVLNLCGARTRNGGTCRKPPARGRKRCRLHGGATPIKHGLYSQAPDMERIGDLVVEFQSMENPLDTGRELAITRALLEDWLRRYEETRDALLAWYEDEHTYGPGRQRPASIPDVTEVVRLVEAITRGAKRERDTQNANWISRKDLARLVREMLAVVVNRVPDEDTVTAIRRDWFKLAAKP